MNHLSRRLARQLLKGAPSASLYWRLQAPAGLHTLAQLLKGAPSASPYWRLQAPAGLHTLAGSTRSGICPSFAGSQLVRAAGPQFLLERAFTTKSEKVRAGHFAGSQYLLKRACTTESDKSSTELVKQLAEAVAKHRQDNHFFHALVLILLGGLIASTSSLLMKLKSTDRENSQLTAKLAKYKAKAEAQAKEVENLTALVFSSCASTAPQVQQDRITSNPSTSTTTDSTSTGVASTSSTSTTSA